MKVYRVLLLAALPSLCHPAEIGIFDYRGRMFALLDRGEELAVRTDVIVAAPGWGRTTGLNQAAKGARPQRGEGSQTWNITLAPSPGRSLQLRQTATDQDGRVRIELELTADAEVDAEGVYFQLEAPRQAFAGGLLEMDKRGMPLPLRKPPQRDSLGGETARLALVSPDGGQRLEAELDRARTFWVEDRWERGNRSYLAMIELARGKLAAGAKVKAAFTIRLVAKPDSRPALLTMDAGQRRFRLHGFGGNYCFNIESPASQYTLKNLKQGWARTEMTPAEWEPENDNDNPGETNWEYLKGNDKPDSNLRREFLLAKQIQDMGIPYVISIWQLPEFLYSDPQPKPVRRQRRKVAEDKWDELLECLGSYLLYAKQQYGVEPDLFSFNEANIGVDVLLTPEEHREAIKRIGAHFEKLGLKTKMLLGDATGPRGTHEYVLPAAQDPEAMRYVTAVAFHSWGGATPEQYQAWGDVAEWLGLPLLVTELGVDAAAYNGGMYDTYHYGLREVRMYQELLLYARPQGTQQWEFTADYGTVRVRRNPDGSPELIPTWRFFLVKHFTNLTPLRSEGLATKSDHPSVLFTAFAGQSSRGPEYTLHIANLGSEREITVEGLPAGVAALRAVRTSENENFVEAGEVKAAQGTVRLRVPARCLVTLTTLPAE